MRRKFIYASSTKSREQDLPLRIGAISRLPAHIMFRISIDNGYPADLPLPLKWLTISYE